jgi:hypothetical protein
MAPPLVRMMRSVVLLALCVVSAGRGGAKVTLSAWSQMGEAVPVAIKGDDSGALDAGTQGSTEGTARGIECDGADSGSKRKGARASAKERRGGGGGGGGRGGRGGGGGGGGGRGRASGGTEDGKKRPAAGDEGSKKLRNAEGDDAQKRRKTGKKGSSTPAAGGGGGGESSNTERLEIVCKRCRKEKSRNSQNSLMSYFSSSPAKVTTNSDTPTADETPHGTEQQGGGEAGDAGVDDGDGRLICSRCRRSMEEKIMPKGWSGVSSIRRGCPTIVKLKGYKRNAKNKEVWTNPSIAGDIDPGFRILGSD